MINVYKNIYTNVQIILNNNAAWFIGFPFWACDITPVSSQIEITTIEKTAKQIATIKEIKPGSFCLVLEM